MTSYITTSNFEFKTQRTNKDLLDDESSSTAFYFDENSKKLFKKAIKSFVTAVNDTAREKVGQLALVGILDTSTRQASLYPTKPRKCNQGNSFILEMPGYPEISSNNPKVGESRMWTMRLKSHHKKGRGFNGPVSHIHALYHFNGADAVSSSDSLNRIGFSIFIEAGDKAIILTADGKSRSLNHDAQLLRIKYKPGYELTEAEASESSLYSGDDEFGDYAQEGHMRDILNSCASLIEQCRAEETLSRDLQSYSLFREVNPREVAMTSVNSYAMSH